jgi:hypothetical protein
MGVREKLAHEFAALVRLGLYFTTWIGALVILKKLILEEYRIGFTGMSAVLLGALVLSKVVLILEKVSFGSWVGRQAAWVEVVLRTLLYSFGVVVVLLLEKAFEGRHEHGGFSQAVQAIFQDADINHVWVNSICLGGALLSYNVLWAIQRHLGEGALLRLMLTPFPDEPAAAGAEKSLDEVREPEG